MLAVSAGLVAHPANAQQGQGEPPFTDTGEIDGDLAGSAPPPSEQPRYAPGVWEAYQQQVAAYRQKLAAAEVEQRTRAEAFRRQQEIYQSDLAAYKAARRKYQVERADYEAAIARMRE